MPRIKRWFKMSHDINRDPEMWEFRELIGKAADPIWEEILSIADRNEGRLGVDSPQLHTTLGSVCRVYSPTIRKALVWLKGSNWIEDRGYLYVTNWLKYNPIRDDQKIPPGETKESPPILPTHPTLPNLLKNKSQPSVEGIKVAQLLSDKIYENYPTRTLPTEAQLLNWAHDADRINRIDKHPWPEILELLEWSQSDSFWKSNILSISKFRAKWTQLLAKMGQGIDNGKPKTGADATTQRIAEALKRGV